MDISRINITFLLLLTGITFLMPKCDCNKSLGLDCATTKYNFLIAAKVYPDKDSLNIGDTVWLEINEPVIFKDISTNADIDYGGASNLGTVLTFNKLVGVNNIEYSLDKFNYVVVKGMQLKKTNLDIEFSFIEENRNYLFKLGIIPKEKGVFRFSISNAANVFRKNDNCTKANFALNFKETQLHGYFFKIFDPTAVIDSSNKGNTYYFKVK
jgi:hypothetical protein